MKTIDIINSKNNPKINKTFFELKSFSLDTHSKNNLFLKEMIKLSNVHLINCKEYKNLIKSYKVDLDNIKTIDEIPFLSVRLFKKFLLRSIKENDVFKVLESSGTTGQLPSRIFLDKHTAKNQSAALIKILQSFIGLKRIPMMIIDHPNVFKDKNLYSARGAGINGVMNFAKNYQFLLNDNSMKINFKILTEFIECNHGQPCLFFGFTFMVWEYFLQVLKKNNKKINLENAILIHSGGWKKLENKSVSNKKFKKELKKWTGISKVHNFYGMVEQTGSIFVECEKGYLHSSIFSEIIVRDSKDWTPLNLGKEGVVEVLSVLPASYPGHAILTEDTGKIIGIDDCKCGRKGKYFTISGRIPMAEVRGCSDTFEN